MRVLILLGLLSFLFAPTHSFIQIKNIFPMQSKKTSSFLRKAFSTLRATTSVSPLTERMKDLREQLAQDEDAQMMLAALRGTNRNDDDFAVDGIQMRLVDVRQGSDSLPKEYNAEKLDAYFDARPGAVATRFFQLLSCSSGFLGSLIWDALNGKIKENEVKRASELRDTIASLGPFFIKLGQALSIRPDILSPKAMVELQRLCDKVPSFDTRIAMALAEEEYGRPVEEIFSELTPEPVAAASLGQVYKGTLKDTGDVVALKVQRPMVLETVSLDLYLMRKIGFQMRKIKFLAERTDLVSILDEFAARFFEELDYRLECENGIKIREDMKGIANIVVPMNYPEWTTRKVFVTEWIEGEKLSQSTADDVQDLVNVGVVAYLTQLLDTGFFHADPHPGNLIRTPEGKLCLLDFGLMTQITEDQKYGMIEAISHLVHRDYESIGSDFVKLDFIPRDVDIRPILPALANVFDAALAGGGAKAINFQALAADLAQITFEYPFRIPPYFALIIRAIGVLEGIALVGNKDFAIVDEAYPYISRRLLTDSSPRLKAALQYMVYGQTGVFDVERMLDLLQALEAFNNLKETGNKNVLNNGENSVNFNIEDDETFDFDTTSSSSSLALSSSASDLRTREALKFFFSDDGKVAREFLLEEVTKSVDTLSRNALWQIAEITNIPIKSLPGSSLLRAVLPEITAADKVVIENAKRLLTFFSMSRDETSSLSVNQAQLVNNNMNVLFNPASLLMPGNMANNRRKLSEAFLMNAAASASGDAPSTLGLSVDRVQELRSVLQEFGPSLSDFSLQVISRLTDRIIARLLKYSSNTVFN